MKHTLVSTGRPCSERWGELKDAGGRASIDSEEIRDGDVSKGTVAG